MATHFLLRTKKNGDKCYQIKALVNGKRYSMVWSAPSSWSNKTIEKELSRIERDFENQCNDSPVIESITFYQFVESIYMPRKESYISENTRCYYRQMIDKHIYPVFKTMKIKNITHIKIQSFLQDKQNEGLSKSTLHGIYLTLRQIMKMAYKNQLVPKDVMELVEAPRYKKDDKKESNLEMFTISEVRKIIDALEDEPLKWKAYVLLSIDTGARRGEILGLKWKSVDIKNSRITIENNLCATVDKGIYEAAPKTENSYRTIDVDRSIMELLLQLLKQNLAAANLNRISVVDPFVFTTDGINPMHPNMPNNFSKRFSKKIGMKFTPHKLRHTFASIAITNGADIASVSQKLGHSSKSITLDMYTHADAEGIKRAGDIFRNAIKM